MKSSAHPALLAVVAALSVGVGVTGTLLWTQNRAQPVASPAPPGAQSVSPPSPGFASPGFASPDLPMQPPAQLALSRGNDAYDAQNWPEAIAQYQIALGSGLDTPDIRTDFGNALRFAGQPRKALQQYQIAQKQNLDHEQSLFNQGGLWAFSLHDNAKAIAAWRAYLKRFPNGQSAAQARQFIKTHSPKRGGS